MYFHVTAIQISHKFPLFVQSFNLSNGEGVSKDFLVLFHYDYLFCIIKKISDFVQPNGYLLITVTIAFD